MRSELTWRNTELELLDLELNPPLAPPEEGNYPFKDPINGDENSLFQNPSWRDEFLLQKSPPGRGGGGFPLQKFRPQSLSP